MTYEMTSTETEECNGGFRIKLQWNFKKLLVFKGIVVKFDIQSHSKNIPLHGVLRQVGIYKAKFG